MSSPKVELFKRGLENPPVDSVIRDILHAGGRIDLAMVPPVRGIFESHIYQLVKMRDFVDLHLKARLIFLDRHATHLFPSGLRRIEEAINEVKRIAETLGLKSIEVVCEKSEEISKMEPRIEDHEMEIFTKIRFKDVDPLRERYGGDAPLIYLKLPIRYVSILIELKPRCAIFGTLDRDLIDKMSDRLKEARITPLFIPTFKTLDGRIEHSALASPEYMLSVDDREERIRQKLHDLHFLNAKSVREGSDSLLPRLQLLKILPQDIMKQIELTPEDVDTITCQYKEDPPKYAADVYDFIVKNYSALFNLLRSG